MYAHEKKHRRYAEIAPKVLSQFYIFYFGSLSKYMRIKNDSEAINSSAHSTSLRAILIHLNTSN